MIDRRLAAASLVLIGFVGGVGADAWLSRAHREPPTSASAPSSSSPSSPSSRPAPTTPATPASASSASMEAVFTDIYAHAKWGRNDAGVGTSGSGSMLVTTLLYRTFLQRFMKDAEVKSVVDAGCGDWEFSQAIDWSGVDYKGYDIVESVIAGDKAKFTRDNVHFYVGDVVDGDLPPADLLIVKHVLQHLPNASIERLLAKQLPKYKHTLLVDSVSAGTLSGKNDDVQTGAFRYIDPTRPPFAVRGAKLLTYWDGADMQQVVYVPGPR